MKLLINLKNSISVLYTPKSAGSGSIPYFPEDFQVPFENMLKRHTFYGPPHNMLGGLCISQTSSFENATNGYSQAYIAAVRFECL